MDALVASANAGLVHRLQRPIVYKLFTNVVHYDEKYQGLEEVFLDSTLNDAVGVVKLRSRAETGEFTYSPYWTDAIVHLAGFVLNGNINTPDDVAHISSGFESIRIAEDFSEGKTYHSYVRMHSTEKKGMSVGDVYIFDGDTVIAACNGLKFQMMKKSILNVILGISQGRSQQREVR
jgi:iron transport multicopper oxidase